MTQSQETPMSRTVYVNGAYVPEAEATVSVFDRGFLFAVLAGVASVGVTGQPLINAFFEFIQLVLARLLQLAQLGSGRFNLVFHGLDAF